MSFHQIEVICARAVRGWHVWIPKLAQANGGHSFFAVVDDFGNLVIVP
jgi:hypothetical protein